MAGNQNDRGIITSNSPVRVTVGLLASLALSVLLYLFFELKGIEKHWASRADAHERNVSERIDAISDAIKEKADKTDISDRWRKQDHDVYAASIEAARQQSEESTKLHFSLIQEKNNAQHEAIEKRIDHAENDLKEVVYRVDNHYMTQQRK